MDKSCIRSCAFALGSSLANSERLPRSAFHFMHRFISKRNGKNVAIGIIFLCNKNNFQVFFDKRIRFPDPAEASYMEKEGFLFLPKEREQKLIYFRFQIDFLNIEFYFSFYRNSALLHGIS
jgi:hypothetical protein